MILNLCEFTLGTKCQCIDCKFVVKDCNALKFVDISNLYSVTTVSIFDYEFPGSPFLFNSSMLIRGNPIQKR